MSGTTDALDAIETGHADGLLVARLDRLARKLEIREAVLASVWRRGRRVFAVDQGEVPRRRSERAPVEVGGPEIQQADPGGHIRVAAVVEEVAGADAHIEMIGGSGPVVVLDDSRCGASPSDTREVAEDCQVVDLEGSPRIERVACLDVLWSLVHLVPSSLVLSAPLPRTLGRQQIVTGRRRSTRYLRPLRSGLTLGFAGEHSAQPDLDEAYRVVPGHGG